MVWNNTNVERFRQAAREVRPEIPEDIILAIIWHESRGTIGAVSGGGLDVFTNTGQREPGETRDFEVDGVKVNHALGLMQCIGSVINDYNRMSGEKKVTVDQMVGKDYDDAIAQIRVGTWRLKRAFDLNHKNFPGFIPPLPEAGREEEGVKLAFLAYAQGNGGLKAKLDDVVAAGKNPTYSAAKELFDGKWGKAGEQPFKFADETYQRYLDKRETVEIVPIQPTVILPKKNSKAEDAYMVVLAVVVAIAGGVMIYNVVRNHKDGGSDVQ